jgi:hypothetical protein
MEDNKVKVTLPLERETPGALVYKVPDIRSVAVGQVYVRKDKLPKVNGEWPTSITITVEANA